MVNILSHGGSKTGSLVIFEVFLALVIDLNQYKDIRTIIAKVGTLEMFKKARERAGLWYIVLAVTMIILAVSLIVLAIGLYRFIRGR